MKKLFAIICLEMLVLSCSPIHKCNLNNTMELTDKLETDNNSLLNDTESTYLNKIFETTRKDFDFTNKKVGFLTGSSGKKMGNKEYYFDMHKEHSTNLNHPYDNGALYIFNITEKAESGGYDAAIIYWSKRLVSINEVVKRLREQR
ncbi:hypothetical protein LJC00_00830 [Dysgonomonas sp. OttesenSCG-928-M03]|nr:hypothetical protein [Dysgonomonas sp. OttesenSCG-928-M03]